MEVLNFLENNGLAIWLRESPSILAYPTLLAFHTFGMAFLVGTSAAISLRLLGFASSVPLAPLRKFFPVMWIGFAISASSGALLLMIDAERFLTMPAFYIKMSGIAVALIIMRLLLARVFNAKAIVDPGPVSRKAPVLAGAVLISWTVAIASGRVTAYLPFVGWQTAAAVVVLAAVLLVGGYVAVRLWGSRASA